MLVSNSESAGVAWFFSCFMRSVLYKRITCEPLFPQRGSDWTMIENKQTNQQTRKEPKIECFNGNSAFQTASILKHWYVPKYCFFWNPGLCPFKIEIKILLS